MPDLLDSPAPPVAMPAPSALLQARLGALGRRRRRVTLGAGLAGILGLLVLLLAAEMLLDYWLDLPWPARAVLLAAISTAAWLVAARSLLLPCFHPPDDDALALWVERERTEFRGRLIAAIQLTRPGVLPPGAAPSLVGALVAETEAIAAPLDFRTVVSTRTLKRRLAWAIALFLAALAALIAGGPDARDLLRRAFLSRVPVPRKTRVFVVQGDKVVGRGDTVHIEATASGLLPRTGTLAIKSLLRRDQEFIMERVTNAPNRFHLTLENVQRSFDYAVRLNDGSSPTHSVKVLPRPSVVRLECEQSFPSYTELAPVKRSPGDLALLAGSRLRVAATASQKLRQAVARLEGLPQTLPLTVDPGNPRLARGEIPIPARALTGFSFQLVDSNGMESRDPALYRIDIVPDRPPTARLTAPERKEELVTRQGLLLVGFDATDDFKVSRARLRYRIGEGEGAEAKAVELNLAGAEASRVQRRFEWKLADLAPVLSYGTRLEFWIEVEDNNDVTGPGLGSSEHQLARVVSDDEKRADLLNRAGDFLGTIGDMTTDQEKLNQTLGSIILEKRR